MNDDNDKDIEKKEEAARALETSIMKKRASLTDAEFAFLRALLLDDTVQTSSLTRASKKLNDEILFSIPFDDPQAEKRPSIVRRTHPHQIGLWSAFRDGIRPRALALRGSRVSNKVQSPEKKESDAEEQATKESNDEDSIRSDEEVRPDRSDDRSENSSLAEDDAPPEHYDAWEVLKDEYAADFGYDNTPTPIVTAEDLDDDNNNYFKILGTSADDKQSHPHVLSPPLMDSLMTFLPAAIKNQNYWLKYSLVRDGASLAILRRYVRGARRTILAIETTDGHVFGSFTSTNWRYERSGFYGTGESFLWRMRHSRKTKCSSLFDQAQLESEVDVYVCTHENEMIQLSTDEMIAVGGGEVESDTDSSVEQRSNRFGFGLSIDDFMLHGTSSPCATYRNPCLVDGGSKDKPFRIANVEVWTFTPCTNVADAERLEMSHYWIQQSSRELSSTMSLQSQGGRSPRPTRSPRPEMRKQLDFDGNDFSQESFYRRVGENDESEQQRDIWQYATMMNTTK